MGWLKSRLSASAEAAAMRTRMRKDLFKGVDFGQIRIRRIWSCRADVKLYRQKSHEGSQDE